VVAGAGLVPLSTVDRITELCGVRRSLMMRGSGATPGGVSGGCGGALAVWLAADPMSALWKTGELMVAATLSVPSRTLTLGSADASNSNRIGMITVGIVVVTFPFDGSVPTIV
jgi:hypothetical protein